MNLYFNECLKFIINTDRFIQSIFLVSGYDIPILPARDILSIDITKSIVFFRRMSDIYRSSNNTLKQHNNLQIGAQWMCTTRALSQFLYQYDSLECSLFHFMPDIELPGTEIPCQVKIKY